MNAANDSQYKRRPEERLPPDDTKAILAVIGLSALFWLEVLISWGVL